jgi:hypothetical protein
MFENITKWIIDNKDSLISGVIGNGMFCGILQLWSLKNKIPNGAKTLMNITIIKYLVFMLLYALPLETIIFMIVDKTTEPTFKNIALFIIICVSLIFNILMSHIRAIYKMFTELTFKSSDNDDVHKKAINIIFEAIGKTERIK